MPLNFLFGTILLGGVALKDKIDREYAKDLAAKQEEYYKESERRETARRTEKYAPITREMKDIFIGYVEEYALENREIPNTFMQGGEMYHCLDARCIEDTIQCARNNVVSFMNPQPRWRFAKVSDFRRCNEYYAGTTCAAIYSTRFYCLSNNIEFTEEQWEQFKDIVDKYGHQYGFNAVRRQRHKYPEW